MSDMNQILMNMLLSGQGGQANLEEMLNDNSDLDPMARMVLSQALSTSNAQKDEDHEIDLDDDDEAPSRRRRAIKRLRSRFTAMQQQIELLQQQIEELETHNDELAAALGACYLCWGQDSHCPECHGKGKPGTMALDWALFEEWVLPAVRAARELKRQHLERQATVTQPKTREEPQHVG
ncbi:hypothetical protein [Myxacorys almedinensis]|uniref:Uncharacterized protein n=1 Tax=Myxacorys almedinensis A TaxID=2690445 RepID=A0A8J7YXN5_9CYAN|nr:hypothetical protein [Myxacorys almedinensis]NDJ16439.1 hypothetical protein [Myxacorys almedinensis A]